jgi:uncharacterized membrane protein
VIEPFHTVLVVVSLALAVATAVYVVLGRSPDTPLVGAMALLEAALVAQLVVGVVQLVDDDRSTSPVVFVGYLIGILLVLPAGVLWSLAERSRSGTAVLIIACLTVTFLLLRLGQLWHG